jgi:hypothetical protein
VRKLGSFNPNNERRCHFCKLDKKTKGGKYFGLRRIFVCKECKPKLEKKHED